MFIFIFLPFKLSRLDSKQCMNQHSCRCDHSPDLIDNNPVTPSYDFDNPIYHAEEEGEEDCDLLELARLLKQEEKVIQSQKERVEIVNLYTAEVRKEMRIGAASEASREQNGSIVERACGCLHLVMSGYARVGYRCRCAQATMERKLSSREAERRCHVSE